MPTYADYYLNTITSAPAGLKLVLGGTGLGKTSAIPEVITSVPGRKFIYCANRIQLVRDLAKAFDKADLPHAHVELPEDATAVRNAMEPDASGIYVLLDSEIVRQYVASEDKHSALINVRKHCRNIERFLHANLSERDLNDAIRDNAREVINFFKKVVVSNAKMSEKAKGKRHSSSSQDQQLLDHPVIQKLFPYVAFRQREEIRILLLTVQKGFGGFFDGRGSVTLPTLNKEDTGNIIFLDEFDFLENDLLDIICKQTQIDAPFQFVELFYTAMKRHKLPLDKYPFVQKVRERIEDIVDDVDKLQQDEGINYPQINQFTQTLDNKRNVIFQTASTHYTGNLYLRQTHRSFEILNHKELNTVDAIHLFKTVHAASSRILYLLKELKVERPNAYREILRACYRNTLFEQQIERIGYMPSRSGESHRTSYDDLYETGYGLYEVQDLQQETDQEEVDFRHYAVPTSPEKMLASLASVNLVFGLSATADIPRVVRHFSSDWLKRSLGEQYFKVSETDRAIIAARTAEKARKRSNNVHLEHLQALAPRNDFHKKLLLFIEAVSNADVFGSTDGERGYRIERVKRFFVSLLWICNRRTINPLNDTHLMFFTSFKQIKHIFDQHRLNEDDLFRIEVEKDIVGNVDFLFKAYSIYIAGEQLLIVFYDADQARRLQSVEHVRKHYESLFQKDLPVVLITQYPSAGNGINLQFRPDANDDREWDFGTIHLLDEPYYFFERWDNELSETEKVSVIKKNVWYSAKLLEEGLITRSRFIDMLSNVRASDLHRYYRGSHTAIDSLNNRIATLIQAFGRIERVWSKMPDQTVIMSDDVYEAFQTFCTSPAHADIYESRQDIISSNLRVIFGQIVAETEQTEQRFYQQRDSRMPLSQRRSQHAVSGVLRRLQSLRAGKGTTEDRQRWLDLRIAALKHDFENPIMQEFFCTHRLTRTEYKFNNIVLVNKSTQELYPHPTKHRDIYEWRLNSAYDLISANPLIRHHFQDLDYRLVFDPDSLMIFTPYVYQAILLGAIGEEAVGAILSRYGVLFDEVPDPIFEIADLHIANTAWYIDCKNYTERTMDNFDLPMDDPAWHEKLNDHYFRENALRKLGIIQQYHGQAADCKLIYLNLASREDRVRSYRDANFNNVSTFDAARIIVVQGVLNRDHPQQYNAVFESFIEALLDTLNVEE